MSIPQALESLRPGAEWTLIDDAITWSDTSQTEPTKAEIDAEIIRLEYVQNRREEYPEIGDQLDDLYHAGAFSTEMTAKLKKVKDDNPKG